MTSYIANVVLIDDNLKKFHSSIKNFMHQIQHRERSDHSSVSLFVESPVHLLTVDVNFVDCLGLLVK